MFERVLEQVFTLVARGDHPLGAVFLHGVVGRLDQASRDAVLCPFLHRSWEGNGAAKRFSDWALHPGVAPVTPIQALDWATTLCWCCGAADRGVRDSATVAITRLLERYLEIVGPLIERVLGVDDNYILERALLAVYSSLLRSRSQHATAVAAGLVFADAIPTNALIRDHARCIVELAATQFGWVASHYVAHARPPYGSTLPAPLTRPGESDWEEFGNLLGEELHSLDDDPGADDNSLR